MSATTSLLSYVLTAAVFLLVDGLWLGIIARNLYRNNIGHLMANQVNWAAAVVFYIVFVAAILLFVVFPAAERESLQYALLYGLAFGFITYATYDLTNLATLRDWSVLVTVIDIIWGSALTAIVSIAGYYIVTWLQ